MPAESRPVRPAPGSQVRPAPGSQVRPAPLAGVRVLDLTRVLSGPHAARMLCDLGADVIKVEPPAGDLTRFSNPRRNGLATYFIQQNVGKRNISIDLAKPEGVELLLGLAEVSDVLIENFRPGVMERLGLGYAAVSARNPRLVYASINGYGHTGPWVTRRAYAPVVGAETGWTKAQGDARGGQYANDTHSNADVYAGMECAAGILAALYHREHTGRGDWVEVTMGQTMLYVNEHVHDHLWDGPVPDDWVRSFGNGDFPVVRAGNGQQVVISGHPASHGTFELYLAAMGRPQLAADPRFTDVASRKAHLPELVDIIRDWAATMPDPQAIEDALGAHSIATGTLRSVREIADSDWATERHAIVAVSDRGGGTVRIPNSPWWFAGADTGVHGEPRYRGEDNRQVLHELLGLDDSALDTLEAHGVLSSRGPRPS